LKNLDAFFYILRRIQKCGAEVDCFLVFSCKGLCFLNVYPLKSPCHFFLTKTTENYQFCCIHLRNFKKLESNCRMLYFICLKAFGNGKKLIKFDHTNWKILAFKVRKKIEYWPTISDDFDCHLWKIFAL